MRSTDHPTRAPGHPRRAGRRHPAASPGTATCSAACPTAGGWHRQLLRDGDLSSTLRHLAPALDAPCALAPAGGPQPGDGWVSCADLQTPGMVESALTRLREAQSSSPEVAASTYLGWYAANVAGPAVAAYTVARRVPDLARERMSLHLAEGGWFDATAFHGTGMAVLPDDPALLPDDPALTALDPDAGASTPGSRVHDVARVHEVADDDALRARLVGEVVGHLEPMVALLRSRVRLGLPALWGAVATQCARAFLLTERITRDPHLGRAEADAFFAAACPPLRARPTWHEFVHRGRHHTGMRRGSCCLSHEMTSQYCTTCPFTSDAVREHRLRTWIDTQGHGGLAV